MKGFKIPEINVKAWLWLVLIFSYFYVFGFTILGLLSSTELMYEKDKKFWTAMLLLLNFAYCSIALIHLFCFDRKGRLISEPRLSRYSNLLLCFCPFVAAAFDPLKPFLINSQILNGKAYFTTGIILAFIISAVASCIIAYVILKKTDKNLEAKK
ncbi:hypothetical protein C1Y41_05665 [Pantoea sp. ICBG 1758]|uniref:hypothetical protein n=1 Tax=Pantoea sp. ICBG 1758 TaxID=2071682 RepID=UPI000CE372EA|nr:hypothetical protein [Pantoea sp. ICBG 1758]PPC64125.1 hypothetical protein C1Y41_05665 [Pantoea sp. ICBG 1758]